MQAVSKHEVAAHIERLITEQLPGRRGVEAWRET
jgi:hypothetical protein